MTAPLVSVLIASLLGSAHCAAMCGAFACSAVDPAARAQGGSSRTRSLAMYHLGRLAGYVAIGLAVGSAGAGLDRAVAWDLFGRPAALVAGVVLVAWGLARLLALAGVRVPSIVSPRIASLASRLLQRAAGSSPTVRAAALGAIAPLLPCGWLYAFAAPAAATASPLGGAAVMATFWIGTLPALTAVAFGLQRMLGPARRALPLFTAAGMIVVGSFTILRATRATERVDASTATLAHPDHAR